MNLHLYRMSLSERRQSEILVENGAMTLNNLNLTRYAFLRAAFTESFSYEPRGGLRMKYIPLWHDDGIIRAIVAKLSIRKGRHDESDPLAIVSSPDWDVCDIYINLNDDEQVIGIDSSTKIQSKTINVVRGLVEFINKKSNKYKIDSFPIYNTNSFWDSISKYDGTITNIKFELVIPNPPNTIDPTKAGLLELKKKINLRKRTEIFENEEGLNLDDPIIVDRENYASAGNGETVAKDKRITVFDSKNRVKTVKIVDKIHEDKSKITEVSSVLSANLRDNLKRR